MNMFRWDVVEGSFLAIVIIEMICCCYLHNYKPNLKLSFLSQMSGSSDSMSESNEPLLLLKEKKNKALKKKAEESNKVKGKTKSKELEKKNEKKEKKKKKAKSGSVDVQDVPLKSMAESLQGFNDIQSQSFSPSTTTTNLQYPATTTGDNTPNKVCITRIVWVRF